MHAMDVRMNLIKYYDILNDNTVSYGLSQAETNIAALIAKYPGLTTNMYLYNMTTSQTTLSIDSIATHATIGSNYTPTSSGAAVVISDVTDVVLQDMHVLFVTQYAAATATTPFHVNTIGTFGARGYMHPHAYYFVFYQLSNTQVLVFYADMSVDFFAPSFRLAGDMIFEENSRSKTVCGLEENYYALPATEKDSYGETYPLYRHLLTKNTLRSTIIHFYLRNAHTNKNDFIINYIPC
jgi:hypothetical protein